jgi:hypothetical protein
VDADQAAGLHAGPSQGSRPRVDLSSELPIGQGPAVADEGSCVWGSPNLFVEQVHQRVTAPEHQHPSRPQVPASPALETDLKSSVRRKSDCPQ